MIEQKELKDLSFEEAVERKDVEVQTVFKVGTVGEHQVANGIPMEENSLEEITDFNGLILSESPSDTESIERLKRERSNEKVKMLND